MCEGKVKATFSESLKQQNKVDLYDFFNSFDLVSPNNSYENAFLLLYDLYLVNLKKKKPG